jgi:hypothetical protein
MPERLKALHGAAHEALASDVGALQDASRYYFDGQGTVLSRVQQGVCSSLGLLGFTVAAVEARPYV